MTERERLMGPTSIKAGIVGFMLLDTLAAAFVPRPVLRLLEPMAARAPGRLRGARTQAAEIPAQGADLSCLWRSQTGIIRHETACMLFIGFFVLKGWADGEVEVDDEG